MIELLEGYHCQTCYWFGQTHSGYLEEVGLFACKVCQYGLSRWMTYWLCVHCGSHHELTDGSAFLPCRECGGCRIRTGSCEDCGSVQNQCGMCLLVEGKVTEVAWDAPLRKLPNLVLNLGGQSCSPGKWDYVCAACDSKLTELRCR